MESVSTGRVHTAVGNTITVRVTSDILSPVDLVWSNFKGGCQQNVAIHIMQEAGTDDAHQVSARVKKKEEEKDMLWRVTHTTVDRGSFAFVCLLVAGFFLGGGWSSWSAGFAGFDQLHVRRIGLGPTWPQKGGRERKRKCKAKDSDNGRRSGWNCIESEGKWRGIHLLCPQSAVMYQAMSQSYFCVLVNESVSTRIQTKRGRDFN